MSPVGGLLEPCSAADDWGVVVDCVAPEADGRTLLAPISPGLYRSVRVTGFRRIALGEPIAVEGPGLLAFDGDRERRLEPGQRAWLSVERDGPFVIDADATLRGAAERGVYLDRSHWHDHRDDVGLDCC
jgi:hypothetical protein